MWALIGPRRYARITGMAIIFERRWRIWVGSWRFSRLWEGDYLVVGCDVGACRGRALFAPYGETPDGVVVFTERILR